jgi:DNA-directed RNA polymerase omega subunit
MATRDIPEKIDSKFRYVLLASQRAEQIMRGAEPKLEETPGGKVTSMAMKEISDELVSWEYGADEDPEAAEPSEDETASEDKSE